MQYIIQQVKNIASKILIIKLLDELEKALPGKNLTPWPLLFFFNDFLYYHGLELL